MNTMFKMGDSPTVYYFFKPDGTLRTSEEAADPTIDSGGGRFVPRPSTNKYWQASIDPADKLGTDNRLRGANTLYIHRTAVMAAIDARFEALGHQPFRQRSPCRHRASPPVTMSMRRRLG